VVVGLPASLQSPTHRRQGWKKIVAREARIAWGSAPPLKCKALFEMIFYYEGLRADVDNIIKYTRTRSAASCTKKRHRDVGEVLRLSATVSSA
jgi:hypothetical protein